MALLLPPLLSRVRAAAPKLKLAVRHGTYATLESDMRERKIDLALVIPQFTPPGLRSRKLFSETYAGAVRPDHALAKSEITLDSFCAYPHLLVAPNRGDFSGPTDEALSKLGRKRDVALVVPSFSVVAALLEPTDLVAVLPARLLASAHRPLFTFKTPVVVEGFELHAVWPDRLHAEPMHRWFRAACMETATAIKDGGP
jgi:DNA-binding transcriptional LysR family regulator